MARLSHRVAHAVAVTLTLAGAAGCATRPVRTEPALPAVLWQDPAQRPSAPRRPPPAPPFQFVEEDREGASPKFLVVDRSGARWQVKLGPEAQTETVAVRLMTAAGYFADDTYFLPRITVPGIRARLTRGREFVVGDDIVRHARLEARHETIRRGDTWEWSRNPFVGTTELDALRALMVVINNYDARTANNRIVDVSAGGRTQRRYIVADVGASFGEVGGMGGRRSKNDPEGYRTSPFIAAVTPTHVEFAYRTRPRGWATTLYVFNPFYVAGEMKKERDLARVPRPAARWLAARVSAIPPAQIRGVFEEAGYSGAEAKSLITTLTGRIQQLSRM